MAHQIHTAAEAINALGGTYAIAKLFNLDPRVISNWRVRGLPPDTYHVMAPLLAKGGLSFDPDKLFGQRIADDDAKALAQQQAKAARIRSKPHRPPQRKAGKRR